MKYLIPVTLFFIMASCGKEEEFTGETKSIYDAYNPGDTLVFKSIKTGDSITYAITRKTNDIKSLPPSLESRETSASIFYKDVTNNSGESRLVEITSFYYNVFLTFGDYEKLFFNQNFGPLNGSDTIHLFARKMIDYYTLYDDQPGANQKIQTIVWQQKYGIIKYDLSDGDSYVRTNIP
jgi:hypothetical protein